MLPAGAEEESRVALDLACMRREAGRMVRAGPRAVLLRLKGEWGGGGGGCDVLDGAAAAAATAGSTRRGSGTAAAAEGLESALTYKELEMERKRWMVCALRHIDGGADPEGVLSRPRVRPKVQRILSLFDSQGELDKRTRAFPSID